MTKYNHMLEIAFAVITEHEDGEDITWEEVKAGLLKRIDDLDPANNKSGYLEEYKEATLPILDTYIMDEENVRASWPLEELQESFDWSKLFGL